MSNPFISRSNVTFTRPKNQSAGILDDYPVRKNIDTQEMRISRVHHAYGGFQDKNETLTIANKDEWTFLTNATNNLFTGNEASGITLSGDVMTFQHGGDYTGNLAITLTGDTGQDFQLRIFNITQNKVMGYKIGVSTDGAGNFSNLAIPLYLEVNAGDQLRMEIQNISSDKDPTFKNCIFYIAYLHE